MTRAPRELTNRQIYNSALWQRLRRARLMREPLCRRCATRGRLVPATVADHITPHRGNRQLAFAAGNLQSLCATCHNGWKQRMEKAAPADQCGVDGYPTEGW